MNNFKPLFFFSFFVFICLNSIAQQSVVTCGLDFIYFDDTPAGIPWNGYSVSSQNVKIAWVTDGERSVSNYQIQRSQTGGAPWTVINTQLPKGINAPGLNTYTYFDNTPCTGAGTRKYVFYRIVVNRISPSCIWYTKIVATHPQAYCK